MSVHAYAGGWGECCGGEGVQLVVPHVQRQVPDVGQVAEEAAGQLAEAGPRDPQDQLVGAETLPKTKNNMTWRISEVTKNLNSLNSKHS